MAKKAFNLAAVLGEVSSLDTGLAGGREQIQYINVDQLHGDPNNFYELKGIEELAGNIEFLGLQQPVRVREVEDGYMIVSGHRRTAAIRKLVEDGREDFRQVPCIVEATASSPELQELRLIYANSDTRVMSPAEQWKQAKRIGELLAELREQGMEFPGRMRDHVAQICKVSNSKLARLKVIDDKLKPEGLRKAYEDGRLNETCAYEIARRSEAAQQLADEQLNYIVRRSAEEISGIMDGLEREAEKQAKVERNVSAAFNRFSSTAEDYVRQRASEDADFFSILQFFAASFARQLPQMGLDRKENIESLKRLLRNSGGGSRDARYDGYSSGKGLTLSSYARAIPSIARNWTEVYDMLAVIAINELGRKPAETVEPVTAAAGMPEPVWQTGSPTKCRLVAAKFDLGDGDPEIFICEYDRFEQAFFFPEYGERIERPCLGWWPIPEDGETANEIE